MLSYVDGLFSHGDPLSPADGRAAAHRQAAVGAVRAHGAGADDAAQAKWFPIGNIPPLAFDHDRILRVALKALREKIHFEPVGFELLPEVFTMPQLQDLYESVLEVKFDRRNFASKMLKFGLLKEVDDGTIRKGTRIPIKYSFNPDSYAQMKAKGFRLEF